MAGDLKSKTALVTGGSRNIGRETALALARKGADVVITYARQADAARSTVQALEAQGVRAASLQANLTGTAELDRLVADFEGILRRWERDRFDFLINNAGTLRVATFDQVTEADVDASRASSATVASPSMPSLLAVSMTTSTPAYSSRCPRPRATSRRTRP